MSYRANLMVLLDPFLVAADANQMLYQSLFAFFSAEPIFWLLVALISAGVVCSELPIKKVAEEYRSERSE